MEMLVLIGLIADICTIAAFFWEIGCYIHNRRRAHTIQITYEETITVTYK